MKRYKFHQLALEITRRCNKKCLHCMRGDAQNVTMTHKMIDKIIDDVADVTTLALHSGEVLLEIDTIDYLVQKINNSHWTTKLIELTTNGTICDKRIINIFESFCLRKDGNYAVIRVSNDQFHNPDEYKKAYAFYEQLVIEANKRIKAVNQASVIIFKYVLEDSNEIKALQYTGKAKELIDNGNTFKHGVGNTGYPYKYGHRIKIANGIIPCSLQISANGNVTYDEGIDYITLDEISFGNILKDNLTNIIDKHNDSCMVLCSETDKLRFADYGKYYADWGESVVPLYFKLRRILYDRIIELRKLAKEKFPYVPAAEIISKIQFPNQLEEGLIIMQLHNSCKCASTGGKMAFKLNQDSPHYAEALNLLCLELLYGIECEPGRKRPYHLFGNLGDKLRWLRTLDFGSLQRKYWENPELIDNSKNFYCNETADNTINYKADTSDVGDFDIDDFIQRQLNEDYEDKFTSKLKEGLEKCNISYDDFMQAYNEIQEKKAEDLLNTLEDSIQKHKIS